MLQNFCEFSTDYLSHLRSLKDPSNILAAERIIQFPFAQSVTEEKTEEELAKIAEKRKEQGRKLQEMAAKSRQEKVPQCPLCHFYLILTACSWRKKRRTYNASSV
jgi:actin-related protein 5